MEQVSPWRLHHTANKHDPNDGDGNKYFPAQTHNLVIAVPWERRPEP